MCWATNKYFAKLYGVSERSITVRIANLAKFGFIHSDVKKDKGNVRYITILNAEEKNNCIENNFGSLEENFHSPIEENFGSPIEENFGKNNINNNNINNNINKNINKNNYLKCVSNMSKKGKSYILLGEFKNVKLTEEELKKVVENYQWYFEDAIEALSSYLEFKGDKYKSHYAVLGKTNWVWRKVHDNQDCGIRPVCNMIPDPTQVGGLRKETAWEYYSKKYGWDF